MTDAVAIKKPKGPLRRNLLCAALSAIAPVVIAAVVVYPTLRTRGVIADYAADRIEPAVAVRQLGGKSEAIDRLLSYLKAPKWLAPDKKRVPRLLSYCDSTNVDALIGCLGHEDYAVRIQAMYVLADMGEDARKAVPALRDTLRSPRRIMREISAEALGRIGKPASIALPVLEECLRDSEEAVRENARIAIRSIRKASLDPNRPLPPILQESRFLKDVDARECQAAAAPEKPQLFRWDFSKTATHTYRFFQHAQVYHDIVGFDGASKLSTKVEGVMMLKSKSGGAAELVFRNLTTTTQDEDEAQQNATPRSVVVQGVKEDGSIGSGGSNVDLMMRVLLPLPQKPLAVGESCETPISLPWNVSGSQLQVTGTVKMTLAGYVLMDGFRCARLETAIDIADLSLPEEIEGQYQVMTRGRSVTYFNVEEKRLHLVELALVMSSRVDAPEQMTGVGSDRAQRIRWAMDSDNLILIKWLAPSSGDAPE